MANYSFVKFQRGTLAAYNNLRTKDPDTLYFIYADVNNQYGSLYLGNKLISGGEVSVISSSMSDLTDTQLSDVQDGQILIYDSSIGKWKNFDLATAIENAGIKTGATVNNITPDEGKTDAEALEEISSPVAGDIAFIGDNIYIYDGTEWKKIAGAQEEIQQRNLWTLNGPLYLTESITAALTPEAKEKMVNYSSETPGADEEFRAWIEEHRDEFEWVTNISARIANLIGEDETSATVGDIVFAQSIKYPQANDEIDSIYQITLIDRVTVELKSLLQGAHNAEERITNLETLVGTPADGDSPATGLHAVVAEKITATEANQLITTAVSNLNHLSYQKVNNLNDIILDAENADRYIYLVPQNPGSENDSYDEYLVIDGNLEKMGQWGVGDLSNLQNEVNSLNQTINGIPATQDESRVPGLIDQISNLQNIVGDITQLFNYNSENPITIVDTINEINERLIWGEMENPNNGN